MATPRHIHIFAKCGLQIEIDASTFKGLDYTDSSTPWKYKVTNYDQICSDGRTEDLTGWLSPTGRITLPPSVKARAGIPDDATSYAFMYPPQGLAETLLHHSRKQEPRDSFDHNPKSSHPIIYIEAIKSAATLGGFAYFDKNCDCICINALSLHRCEGKLRFAGPYEVSQSACDELCKLRRPHPLQLDIFHEAGFVSYAWVRPQEIFRFKSTLVNNRAMNNNGAMIFFRENGTGVAYCVDNSDYVDPTGHVGILSEAVQKIGEAKFTKKVFQPIDEVNAWRDRVKHWTKSIPTAKLAEKLNDKKRVIHMACHAILGHEFISDVLSNVEEKHNLSYQDSFGWNPLHYACCFSPSDCILIKLLVAECPEAVVQLDIYHRSPLHIACNNNTSEEVIAVLLKADTSKVTLTKKTRRFGLLPLHLACFNSAQEGIINALLDADHDGKTAIQKSRRGILPLHLAILKKLPPSIVKAFLDKDSKLRKSDNSNFDDESFDFEGDIYQSVDGKIPLHLACYNNSSSEIIQLLLEKDRHNITVNEVVNTVPFSEELGDGLSGVDSAASMISMYKKLKAKTTARKIETQVSAVTLPSALEEQNDGVVALHLAMIHGSKEVISLFLHQGMERGTNELEVSMLHKTDALGRTPLHIACQCNVGSDIIQHLLQLDPFKKTTQMLDVQGFLPLHYACENKKTSVETINILLDSEEKYIEKKYEEGVIIRKSTHTGDTERKRTPLYLAVKSGVEEVKVIERLLQPENFFLKDFDEPAIDDLADVVKSNRSIQAKVIGRLSERVYFCFLILELYACIVALISFMVGSFKLDRGSSTLIEPILLILATLVFIFRELLQILSVGTDYIGDIWSWVEIANIALLLASSSMMIQEANSDTMENENVSRTLLSFAGFLVTLQFIFYLRSTFLPFARFVGGLLMILTTLIPFLVVSALLVWAFIFAFWLRGNRIRKEDPCSTLLSCFNEMIGNIFDYGPDNFGVLESLFAFIIIIVLLNVVIAIVGEAWESAAEQSNTLFWKYRLDKIYELRYALKLRDSVGSVIPFTKLKYSYSILLMKIDNTMDISFGGDISWTKAPYNVLTEKDHYDNPCRYFAPDQVKIILDAHSLQADLYWAEIDTDLKFSAKFTIMLKWLGFCTYYVLLLILGIPTFGILWPKKFRAGLLTLGFRNQENMDEHTPKLPTNQKEMKDKHI